MTHYLPLELKSEILREHSKNQTSRLVAYVGNDQAKFDALMDLFFAGDPILTQRVSGVISQCVEAYPLLIEKHLAAFVKQVDQANASTTLKRNIVRVLQYAEIPESLSGYVVDTCFRLLGEPKELVAVKVFSLTVLANLTKKYPELQPEVKLVMEEQLPRTTAAFHSRARKVQRTFLATERNSSAI